MKFGKAYAIFYKIDSPDFTDEEKCEAIYHITQMETHNSITKAAMLKVIWWLLNLVADVPEDAKPPTDTKGGNRFYEENKN